MAKKTTKKTTDEVIEGTTVESSDAPEKGLVAQADAMIVKPMISPAQAAEAWKAYTDLCNAILVPTDFTKINTYATGKGTTVKLFKNKSAWRKLATAFNLSVEVEKEERKEFPEYFVVQITARVTAPNGRIMHGTGSCASNERKFAHQEHDVRAQAETRAKSRAISDMIGAGETTAEEMMQMEEKQNKSCPRDHAALPQKIVTTEGKNKGRPYKKCPACTYFEWQDEPAKEA